MAFGKIVLFTVAMMALFVVSKGVVYRVGDSAGWTLDPMNVNYQQWAVSKSFYVGDTIVFQYNIIHDVIRVTHKQYLECNTTAPRWRLTSGNDTIQLRRPTHLYFLCSIPGHCQAGQKVDIRVSSATSDSNGSISSLDAPSQPLTAPANPASKSRPLLSQKSSSPELLVGSYTVPLVAAISFLLYFIH